MGAEDARKVRIGWKRCQRHQKLKYKAASLRSCVCVCVGAYTIVNKKGSGCETNKPRHPIQPTHTPSCAHVSM